MVRHRLAERCRSFAQVHHSARRSPGLLSDRAKRTRHSFRSMRASLLTAFQQQAGGGCYPLWIARLQYGRDGKCIDIGKPNFGVRRYPAAERGPWLWVWMGDAELADESAFPLDDFPEDWPDSGDYVLNQCNYMLVIETVRPHAYPSSSRCAYRRRGVQQHAAHDAGRRRRRRHAARDRQHEGGIDGPVLR